MKITQLSIFLENKPGQLKRVCDLLAKAKINILTLSLADTKQFGILRLIVNDSEQAKTVLAGDGLVANATEVLALAVIAFSVRILGEREPHDRVETLAWNFRKRGYRT